MEGSSSSSPPPSNANQSPTGASKFLADLPTRGLLSSTVLSSPLFPSNLGGMRVYVCDHKTSPPENQQIRTHHQNILIESLLRSGKTSGSSSKDAKLASDDQRERAAEKAVDTNTSRPEVSDGRAPENLSSLTVDRLHALKF